MIGVPPFVLDGVVMRIFPLKANMRALTTFCDQYLNLMPPEIAVFRPAAPYVMLAAINYGRMGAEASNLGWVSQNEVVFGVPLTRSRVVDGKEVFEDWATVSPFIYVDEQSSLATGREVYGWPKTNAWLTPGINEWARHPDSPQDVFVLSSMVIPELFAGQRQQPRVLFKIKRRPDPAISNFPLDLRNPLNPLLSFPKAMIEGMSVIGEMAQAVAALPLQGYPTDRNAEAIPDMFKRAQGYLDIFNQLPSANTVNLKQFRDARDANAACYQAITTAPMTIARFNGGGLLGDMAQWRGDPTGGYSVRLHRYPTHPIIESLGLEVETQNRVGDHSVATLKTFFPFWVSVDFNYGRGKLVCWRTTQIGWRRDTLPDENPEPPSTRAAKQPYNSARGAATEAISGPFRFPDVTQRVLPLLATPESLSQFCTGYLDNDFSFFRPWGSYVYLIVTTFEEMSSETYNVGWWASRQVSFSFPVKWYKRKQVRQRAPIPESEEGELIGTALLTPFGYTDSELGATTGREMQGLPLVRAAVESPESSWLEESGPARRNDLLRLKANVYAAFHAGQKAKEEVLLEITSRHPIPTYDLMGWRKVAADWGERLYAQQMLRADKRSSEPELYDKARALAVEVLRGDGRPINEISLRQFRDVEAPEEACYQAITLTRTMLEEIEELREIEAPIHVAVHRYPSQPIVETLGLKVKTTDVAGSSVVDYLEPIRPFWMKVSMRVDLGEDVFWRAGSKVWRPSSADWFKTRAELEEEGPAFSDHATPRDFYLVGQSSDVAPEVVRLVDADNRAKRNLRSAWRFWRHPKGPDPECLTREEARAVVGDDPNDPCIAPQLILESLLEHKWCRQERPLGEKLPPFFVPAGSLANEDVRAEYCAKLGFEEDDGRLVHRGLERDVQTESDIEESGHYATLEDEEEEAADQNSKET